MNSAQIIRIWKNILPFVFIIIFVHLLKDITQDILKIGTPLDLLGDAREDLTLWSRPFQMAYLYGLGGLSIIAEVFLLFSIPKVWKDTKFNKLDTYILAILVLLILFFITAILLD